MSEQIQLFHFERDVLIVKVMRKVKVYKGLRVTGVIRDRDVALYSMLVSLQADLH